jgi:hypothetical protein
MVAKQCKKRKRTFTGSAFPDFYTSKLLKRGTWDMFHFAEDAAKAGIGKAERKYIVTGLSYNFRKQLEFSIEQDVPLINIITWNDYPEGHHLAPETNHNDGFSILLNHYKEKWKKNPVADDHKDVLIAFYKKYKHNAVPSPFNIPVVEIERAGVPASTEDSIEIISILSSAARISVNNKNVMVDAGLQSTRFAAVAGPVVVSLVRNDKEVEKLVCPEWITDKPYRTDRLTYSFSNQSAASLKKIFGDAVPSFSAEYNAEANGNHIRYYKNAE